MVSKSNIENTLRSIFVLIAMFFIGFIAAAIFIIPISVIDDKIELKRGYIAAMTGDTLFILKTMPDSTRVWVEYKKDNQ